MKKLTETLIKQRVRSCVTDIEKIIKINLTGRELEDVSLLRKMTNVQILSLSFNKISSLIDFQYCENLKELYLRRNNIVDLNQIYYLKNLNKLEMLMLSENPCSADPLYRETIIKNLPTLQTLDDVAVTPIERREAAKTGKDVTLSKISPEPISNGYFNFDGQQSPGTPPQTSQKFQASDKNQTLQDREMSSDSVEMVQFIHDSKSNINPISDTPSLNALENAKSSHHFYQKESKKCFPKLKEVKTAPCKFCTNQGRDAQVTGNREPKLTMPAPRNPNVLSAAIALIKELDYSGLQIVNAEVLSRLNSYEFEFLCNGKPLP